MVKANGIDVEELCGVSHGIEGAVHAIRELYEEHGWGVLLDAKNSSNRSAALWNLRIQRPRCARFLFNTYRGYASLVVQDSSEFILSEEGVAQGDPPSMLMYAAAIYRGDQWVMMVTIGGLQGGPMGDDSQHWAYRGTNG